MSTIALIALFGTGLLATAGRHVSAGYLRIAGIAAALVLLVLALALLVAPTPASPNGQRAGRPAGRGTSGQASIRKRRPRPAGGSCGSPGPR